jgi:hypothetical protein
MLRVMSAAWPPGFALAAVAADALPYALGAVACLLTLPLLRRLPSRHGTVPY